MTVHPGHLDPPTARQAHVWHIPLGVPDGALAGLRGALSGEERHRADRLPDPVRRRRYIVAHAAIRWIIGRYLGVPPARVPWAAGRWGKPYLTGCDDRLRISLSHTGDLALLAATGARNVGVDVEQRLPGRDLVAVADRYFPVVERRLVRASEPARRPAVFRRLWVRKEACVKAAGTRLGRGLALRVCGAGRTTVVTGERELRGPWLVADVPAAPGQAAALALEGLEMCSLMSLRFRPTLMAAAPTDLMGDIVPESVQRPDRSS